MFPFLFETDEGGIGMNDKKIAELREELDFLDKQIAVLEDAREFTLKRIDELEEN